MKNPRRKFLRLAAGVAALPATMRLASAQAYPTRPITLVVPFSAGGAFDVLARVLTPRLSEILQQQVVVENIGAAAGIVGTSRVSHAPPDGYSVLLGTVGTHAYNPALYKKLPYDPVSDFAPVGLVAEQPMMLVARKDFPANTLPEFIAYVKTEQRQDLIRLSRCRFDDAPCLRAPQCRNRHRRDARSLSRWRTSHGRHDRWPGPVHVLEYPQRAPASARRHDQGNRPALTRALDPLAGASYGP